MKIRTLFFCMLALAGAVACSRKIYQSAGAGTEGKDGPVEQVQPVKPEIPVEEPVVPEKPVEKPVEPIVPAEQEPEEAVREFRGVWLATVPGTDWPKAQNDAAAQKRELAKYLEAIADIGCQVVFFQVCSNMDALWPSQLLPWSSVLSGKEGTDPGYDPAGFAVEKAHELGLEIHAWLNPYRIGDVSKEHAPLSPVKARPELVKKYGGHYYLDPALPGTHAFLAAVATELLAKYPFDGLHIDDYFYPTGYDKDQKGWETRTYPQYGGGKDPEEWRFSNVDASVKALYDATHAARPGAVFGVSPRSRSELYLAQYADPARWVRAGTVDYLIPQIYWTLGRDDAAAFETVLKQWDGLAGEVPVYVGIAAYKMHESYYSLPKNEDFQYVDEFVRQVDVCRKAPGCQGHVWFRAESILRPGLYDSIKNTIYAETEQ